MSLEEIRQKNKLKHSIIYAKIENTMSPEVAQAIKEDVYEGFIKPIQTQTLKRYFEREDAIEEAYVYLSSHPNVQLDGVNYFKDCLSQSEVWVNPETLAIDDNPSLNTKPQVWLEFGAVLKDKVTGQPIQQHDYDFDCGADTYPLALIELAKLVKAKWD